MATYDNSYSTSINDVASGAYASITESIQHSKNNIITLDKMCNWYLFEGQVLMPIPFLNKYKETLINNSYWVEIDSKFYYKPEYVSYNLYGTTDLWYLMLFLNEMRSVEEFDKPRIRVFSPAKMSVLKNIINSETNKYNRDNPRPVSKHYIKNPNLPSDQLLPDDDLVEIMSPGINNIRQIPISALDFDSRLSDYYFKGKSKMEIYKVIEKTYVDTREYHYMDGIRVSNSNSNTVYNKRYNGVERKFTGWINLSKATGMKPKSFIDKDGNYKGYQFIVSGINGTAHITINNQQLKGPNGSEITFSSTSKQYDYFERETRNSDFKQRNITGWTVTTKNRRVATDKEVMKPVFIIDDIRDVSGEVIYGELNSKQLDVSTEPFGGEASGDLFVTFRFKTTNVTNAKVMPFIEVTYTDGTKVKEYAFDTEWVEFINTGEYVDVYLLSNILHSKTLDKARFGIEIMSTKSPEYNKGTFKLDSISMHRINNNTVYNENLLIDKDWVPYTMVYRHNGESGPAMFNLLWKEPGDDTAFTVIPQDCLAIVPDSRDLLNDPPSMKECILVTAEGSKDNDRTYLDILVSKFDRRIDIQRHHSRLIYHTNIKFNKDEVIYIDNINYPDSEFTVMLNKQPIEYKDDENCHKFTPSKYIVREVVDGEVMDDLDIDVLDLIDGNTNVALLEIIDETPYEEGSVLQYSLRSDITGIEDAIDSNRLYIDPLTLNHVEVLGDNQYEIDIAKNSLIELNMYTEEGMISNKEQYMLEFDLTIDSPDRGLFIVNIDKRVDDDNDKYMLAFLYTGEESGDVDDPKFYLRSYAYRISDENSNVPISNIDRGIDFYKYPYRAMYMYKNNLEITDEFNIDNLKIHKGDRLRFFVRKNKQTIILGVDKILDKDDEQETTIIGSWIAPEWEDYLGGICSFQFLNIRHAYMSNVKFSM